MSKLKITQVRSTINCTEKQKRTIKALGLGRPHNVVMKEGNVQIKGMVAVVQHLLRVEEL